MLWHKPGGVGGAVAFVMLMMALTSWCQAGIVVTTRESTLQASGRTSGDEFNLTDTSNDLGVYANTIGQTLPGAGGGATSASASQRSNVAARALLDDARGSASAQVAEFDAITAQARSLLLLFFDVTDQSESLTLRGHVEASFDAVARVQLTNLDTTRSIFDRTVDTGQGDRLNFDEALTLEPASYMFAAEVRVTATPSPNAAEFDVSFSGGGAVIPLPAPIFAGGAMLVLLAPLGRRRHR